MTWGTGRHTHRTAQHRTHAAPAPPAPAPDEHQKVDERQLVGVQRRERRRRQEQLLVDQRRAVGLQPAGREDKPRCKFGQTVTQGGTRPTGPRSKPARAARGARQAGARPVCDRGRQDRQHARPQLVRVRCLARVLPLCLRGAGSADAALDRPACPQQSSCSSSSSGCPSAVSRVGGHRLTRPALPVRPAASTTA